MRAKATLIFAAALVILSIRLASPAYAVFDEYCYTSAAKALNFGLSDTNPEHPPLAKLFIGAGMKMAGDRPEGWRLASTIFGALALAFTFLLVSKVSTEQRAWMATSLVAFNGFWFVMSRVAMLSIFELTFVLIGFYFFESAELCGVFLGLAVACRWNGVFAVALAIALMIARREFRRALLTGLLSVVAYFATWTLVLGPNIRRILEAQLYILRFHESARGTAIATHWYTWGTRLTPEMALNALLANPLIILLGLTAVAVLLWNRQHLLIALAGPLFWLEWAAVARTFSYYYYFLDSVIFLSIAAALWLPERNIARVKASTVVVILSFVWFAGNYRNFTAPNVVEGLAVQAPTCSADQTFITKAAALEGQRIQRNAIR